MISTGYLSYPVQLASKNISPRYSFYTNGIFPDEIDYNKITKRDQLPKLIIPGYDKYSAERAINKLSHKEAMKKAFESEDARERWSDVFKKIYGK